MRDIRMRASTAPATSAATTSTAVVRLLRARDGAAGADRADARGWAVRASPGRAAGRATGAERLLGAAGAVRAVPGSTRIICAAPAAGACGAIVATAGCPAVCWA